MLHNDSDFDTPFAGDDAVIECDPSDPAWGDAQDWPRWCDLFRWETDTDIPDEEAYDEWSRHIEEIMDGQDQAGRLDDRDIETATGCAG
jgi:hypothetical protein